MRVLYICKADPEGVGGVAEVARQHRKFVRPTLSVISPTVREVEVMRLMKHDRASFDLVHLWAGQFPFATLYARQLGLPVVVDRSSTHIDWQRAILQEEYLALVQQGILPVPEAGRALFPDEDTCAVQRAEYESAAVVVPEEHAAGTFEERPGGGLHIVPTGVDADRFRVFKRERDGRQMRVLFSGHNWFRKGLVYLWMAAKSLEDRRKFEFRYDFNVGATGHPAFRLPRLASTDYSFTNYPEGLAKVYPLIDVAVLPTLEDSLPLSVDEAMAAGIPVITTANAGSRVVDGKSGFIVPIRDWAAIAKHLEYFRDNPSEVERMGRNARETAIGATWEAYARRLAVVYEEVLHGQG